MKEITRDTYLKWYEEMLFWRKFEDKLAAVYIQQKVRGFLHLYNGQEAILAGALHVMDMEKDRMITAYRNHVMPIGMGVDPKKVMAELYGKATGTSMGLGGSMHIFSKEHRFHGGHGIVGGQIPLGAGMAFGDKYNQTGAVTLCFFGDGAARQGSLHETFNMAMMWKLPVVFIIENNNYAMGTSVKRTTNVEDMSEMGKSYHMPSFVVDGMSVEAVHYAIQEACERARKGEGPTLLDIRTYRYKGHSMSDPQKYRTKDEVEDYKQKDPITQVLKTIEENNLASSKKIKEIQDEVKQIVDESVKFAEESPDLEPHELYEDVYVQKDYPFIKEFL